MSSSSLGVHLWFDDWVRPTAEVFSAAADCIRDTTCAEAGFGVHPRFRRVVVEQDSVLNVVLDKAIAAQEVSAVHNVLSGHVSAKSMIRLDSAFQARCLNVDTHDIDETIYPLTLRMYGAQYGKDEFYFRQSGMLELTFDVAAFCYRGNSCEVLKRNRLAQAGYAGCQ